MCQRNPTPLQTNIDPENGSFVSTVSSPIARGFESLCGPLRVCMYWASALGYADETSSTSLRALQELKQNMLCDSVFVLFLPMVESPSGEDSGSDSFKSWCYIRGCEPSLARPPHCFAGGVAACRFASSGTLALSEGHAVNLAQLGVTWWIEGKSLKENCNCSSVGLAAGTVAARVRKVLQ